MERDHEQKPPLNRHAKEEHVELPLSDFQEMVYELESWQVDLEVQNESLREIQLELAESQRRSFELFDLAPVGYLTLDIRGNIMDANLMVSHLLGVPRKQLLGTSLLRFVPMKARNAFADYMKRVRAAETGLDMEIALKKGAGGETEVQTRCVSMWDGKEVSERIRVIIIDISERKAAERALRWREEQSNQILNAMNRDILTFRGERKQEKEEKGENFHRIERSFGSFSRTVQLPAEVDAEKVDAVYKDGVLQIKLKKTQKSTGKKIEIKST